MSKWQPIDTAPEGEMIIVAAMDDPEVFAVEWSESNYDVADWATHWMPMPEPPESQPPQKVKENV